MYAVGALMLLFPAIMVTFDARELWQRVDWVHATMPTATGTDVPVAEPRR